MRSRRNDPRLDELGTISGDAEAESGDQAGDSQGLPQDADESGESVEELAEAGQTYEAEVLEGVEDAADHPERPVHTREDQSRTPELPPLPGSD